MKDVDRESPPPDEEPEDGGGELAEICITVPDGIYEVRYMFYATSYFRDQAKVTVSVFKQMEQT